MAKAKKVKPRVLKDGTLCYLSKPFKEESLIVCLDQALNPDSRFGPHSLIGGVLAPHLSDCVIKFSTVQENESDEVEKYQGEHRRCYA